MLRIFRTIGLMALLYLAAWVFGEHGHTYTLGPARKVFADSGEQDKTQWACSDRDQGPFLDNGPNREPVCHVPVRQCPVLWFPLATEVPCHYKDLLGGQYTDDDLFVLRQMQRPKR